MLQSYFNCKVAKLKFFIFLICYAYSVKVFLSGFIPTKISKLKSFSSNSLFLTCIGIVNDTDVCQGMNFNSSYSRHYDKLVLIVIDALRADFIPSVLPQGEFNTSLPFTETLIKRKMALPLINQVHSPTVTLPRIKTITTGGISNFIDVLTNLKTTELNEDNFLLQAKLSGMKIVFYGDDTWLKLFPYHFTRSEGTHSFFVSDFQEVDNNVTKHLPLELSRRNWDIMILHYLGVDHIGHAHGPFSLYLPPKLKEMDEIIKNIYQNLKEDSQTKSLIVICGDHGMTAGGGHGGISEGELLTPLIFINTNNSEYIPSDKIETISQVDICATISVLLGIPISGNSFGSIIPSVLHFSGLTYKHILNAAFYNLLQLFKVHSIVLPNEENVYMEQIRNVILNHSQLLHHVGKEHNVMPENVSHLLQTYMFLLNDLKQNLLLNVSGYDTNSLTIGLASMWLFFLFIVNCHIMTVQHRDFSELLKFSCSPLRTVNNINLILISLLISIYFFSPFTLKVHILVLLDIILFFLLACRMKFLIQNTSLSSLEMEIICLLCLHVLSLFSSSFIEEEHQVWYFFVTTILLFYFFRYVFLVFNCYFENKSMKYQLQSKNPCELDENVIKIYKILHLLIFHRILRSWNQTGSKWQHLPDLSDWLNKKENLIYKYVSVTVSQIAILFHFKSKLTKVHGVTKLCPTYLLFTGSLCIFLFKSEHLCLIFKDKLIDPVYFPRIVYIIITIIILYSITFFTFQTITIESYEVLKNFIIAWVLLIQIIGRSHNIPIVAATLFQEQSLSKILWKNNCKPQMNAFIYFFSALCSFFYLGNSNSLSTIDVYSGYTGLLAYKPLIAGFLITCNTYSTVVLWLLLFLHRVLRFNYVTCALNSLPRIKIFSMFQNILLYKLFVLSVTCVVTYIMKHHLFILSVFAPKLFYELCHVIFCVVLIFSIGTGYEILNYRFSKLNRILNQVENKSD